VYADASVVLIKKEAPSANNSLIIVKNFIYFSELKLALKKCA
jgi:hypothetical protein